MLDQLKQQLQTILNEEGAAIGAADSTAALEDLRVRVFGKKGKLSGVLRTMGNMNPDERPLAGKIANDMKEQIQTLLEAREVELKQAEIQQSIREETLDITLPGILPSLGSLHPITRIQREIEDIFGSMGFSIELGPDIETDYYNFEALNFPPDHPARDMHDSFYLASDLLLRTHTSPVQVHTMKNHKPPLAVIAPGRCYRCDADATHSPMFHQVEGFMVDTNIRFSDLIGALEAFIHQMFGPDTAFRMRPSYFPFTEPSAEVDIFFERKYADGRVVRQWMEVLGSGMIHPNVLSNCGIDPEQYRGFAFGMGIERIAMLKYGINTIYTLYDNDIRFLHQFK